MVSKRFKDGLASEMVANLNEASRRKMVKIPLEDLEEAMADGTIGFCLMCGESADGVEPDARNYPCEACGAKAVFGAEEIVLMGRAE